MLSTVLDRNRIDNTGHIFIDTARARGYRRTTLCYPLAPATTVIAVIAYGWGAGSAAALLYILRMPINARTIAPCCGVISFVLL
jgi:hypothetical protein